jgi:hypothetical protein
MGSDCVYPETNKGKGFVGVHRSTEREMGSDCVYPETNKGKGFVGESVA